MMYLTLCDHKWCLTGLTLPSHALPSLQEMSEDNVAPEPFQVGCKLWEGVDHVSSGC